MGRPRKDRTEAMLDEFSDFPVSVQQEMLEKMNLLHRQEKRRAEKPAEIEQEAAQ